VFGFQGRMR